MTIAVDLGCKAIKQTNKQKLCWCIGHMMSRVLGNILCDLDTKVKVK